MTIAEFSDRVREAGLLPFAFSHDHFQIRGGLRMVNFWPHARKGQRIYVQGMAGSYFGTLADAIHAANSIPDARSTVRHNRSKKKIKTNKKALMKRDPFCHWCNTVLTMQSATIDHVVPLSKGGGNGLDNCVLACEACNFKRADNVTVEELASLARAEERAFDTSA